MSTQARIDRVLLVALGLSAESADLVMREIESLRTEINNLLKTIWKADHDKGIWYQAACSGLWYRNPKAAGNIASIRIEGRRPSPLVEKEILDNIAYQSMMDGDTHL